MKIHTHDVYAVIFRVLLLLFFLLLSFHIQSQNFEKMQWHQKLCINKTIGIYVNGYGVRRCAHRSGNAYRETTAQRTSIAEHRTWLKHIETKKQNHLKYIVVC